MDPIAGFSVTPSGPEERPGALARFPFDRGLLERFREAFPRARFREGEAAWFVPGTTAATRIEAWIGRELSALDAHADDKGRDAFSFDPLASPYLEAGEELTIRTPYSRAVVGLLRGVPFARWDPGARAWRVPYRAYEALRRAWPAIEEAARLAEPDARAARQEARRADPAEAALQAERRRRRVPVSLDHPPPLDRPVVAGPFGVVMIEAIGPAVAPGALPSPYVGAAPRGPLAWARWRLPTWREATWTKPTPEDPEGLARRGWRLPTAADLEERRRALRQADRARATRAAAREGEAGARGA